MIKLCKYMPLLFISLLFLCLLASLKCNAASYDKCSVCSKRIRGGSKYYISGGKKFCSRKCFAKYREKTLPHCAVCGKAVSKGYFKKDGKVYCSRECLSVTLPKCALCGDPVERGMVFNGNKKNTFCARCASLPKCFNCNLPARCRKMRDGRQICPECDRTAVCDRLEAEQILNEVRVRMKRDLGISTKHKIKFRLVDSDELKRKSNRYDPGMELGLFRYEVTTEKTITKKVNAWGEEKHVKTETKTKSESYYIYALRGITRKKLMEVLAHELGHDWMQERYPDIMDMRTKEGWAEYVASQINKLYGQKDMNLRMENNPDKIYGDGYRMIKSLADRQGRRGLQNLFKKQNRK